MKNKCSTRKEVKQVAKEIRKLTKVISVIGETMLDRKITDVENNKERFKELVKEENEKHKHNKWKMRNCT